MSDVPIRVEAIDHVTIVVGDLERSRAFYCDALGMVQVERPDFDFHGRWFQAGNTQVHLILEHDQSGPAGSATPTGSRGHHFAFRVADGRAAAERLRALGIPIASGPKVRPDGAVQTFVRDPDGHLVELFSPPRG